MNSKIYTLSLVILGSFQSIAQEKPYSSKSFDANSIKTSRVETSGGNITVEGGTSSGKAILEMYVKGNGMKSLSDAEIKERLKDFEITMELKGTELFAKAKKTSKGGWNNSLNISFRVIVPKTVLGNYSTSGGNISAKDFTVKQNLSTSGGNVSIKNISGGVEGATSGGNIMVSLCKGNIDVGTSGGNITCESSDGNADLQTSGGSIKIDGFKGSVDASTSGGNVKITNSDAKAKLTTSGGNISAEKLSGSVVASTSGGNIEIEMNKVNGDVELSASSGDINISIPMNVGYDFDLEADKIVLGSKIDIKGKVDFNKSYSDRVDGTYKGGGHLIKADVSSGTITLKN